MLQRPIQSALATPGVSSVIVSTEDEEIANLAFRLGAQVPAPRPDHLAADDTPTAPVIAHEVKNYALKHGEPQFVLVLYPTSIFVGVSEIEEMINRLLYGTKTIEMVMTATKYPAPIERAWRVTADGIGIVADPASRNRQSQDFEDHFYDVGQAYVSRADTWDRLNNGHDVTTALHILPPSRAWDINTPDDFAVAELLLRQYPSNQLGIG